MCANGCVQFGIFYVPKMGFEPVFNFVFCLTNILFFTVFAGNAVYQVVTITADMCHAIIFFFCCCACEFPTFIKFGTVIASPWYEASSVHVVFSCVVSVFLRKGVVYPGSHKSIS